MLSKWRSLRLNFQLSSCLAHPLQACRKPKHGKFNRRWDVLGPAHQRHTALSIRATHGPVRHVRGLQKSPKQLFLSGKSVRPEHGLRPPTVTQLNSQQHSHNPVA